LPARKGLSQRNRKKIKKNTIKMNNTILGMKLNKAYKNINQNAS